MPFKVNEYTSMVSNFFFYFGLPSPQASTLKEKNLLLQSKFFPLKVDPIFGRPHLPVKQNGSHKNWLSLKTWRKKVEVYPWNLNIRMLSQEINVCIYCVSLKTETRGRITANPPKIAKFVLHSIINIDIKTT